MDRRRKLLIGAAAAGVLAAAVLWMVQQRAAAKRATPAWTDPEQPPVGTAGQPVALLPTSSASWSASRPADPGMRGGSRIMRSYSGTLVDDPESVVR